MAFDSQVLLQSSIFGRDRRRGTCDEDGGRYDGLIDSDETQPPSQPLDQTILCHGSSDTTENPTTLQVLSPEGLWQVHQH